MRVEDSRREAPREIVRQHTVVIVFCGGDQRRRAHQEQHQGGDRQGNPGDSLEEAVSTRQHRTIFFVTTESIY